MTTSLCVTDLLNILLVDVPVMDDVADAAAAVPKKGAAIVLPPAGKFSCAVAAYFWPTTKRGGVSESFGMLMRLPTTKPIELLYPIYALSNDAIGSLLVNNFP